MEDIIKVYAKYLGCDMVWIRLNKVTKIKITPFSLHLNSDHILAGDTKLILRTKIEDADVMYILNMVTKDCDASFLLSDIDSDIEKVALIDFLRSKGYAYYIDKGYYITEGEFEKLNKK